MSEDPAMESARPALRITRRGFLLSLLGSGSALAAYTYGWEPHHLEVSRRTVAMGFSAALAPPLRLLHLSDLHASSWVSLGYLEQALQRGLAEKPDLICLTGDYSTGAKFADPAAYSRILRALPGAAPTFACFGNHDCGFVTRNGHSWADTSAARSVFEAAGVHCLENEAAVAQVGGREVQIVGLGDLWTGRYRSVPAFARAGRKLVPRIVLSHNPDTKSDLASFDWDLLLCGHTHGGQVKLPLVGALYAPVEDRRYLEGLHRWDGRWMNISRGIGNLYGVRFNCPPEINLLLLA